MNDKSIVLQSLSGSLEIQDRTYSFDTRAKLRGGGEFDADGKLTSLFPNLLGDFHFRLSEVPFSAIRSIYTPPLTGLSIEYEKLSGEIDVTAQGNSQGKGSIRLKTDSFTFKVNTKSFSQPTLSLFCDFEYENGLPQIAKAIQLDFGKALSYKGRIEFSKDSIKNVSIESMRVDSEDMLALFKPVIPSLDSMKMEGSILIDGQANNFSADWIPATFNLRIKVVDEINLASSGKPISTDINGLTASLTLSADRYGDNLKFSLTGNLLPEQVNLNTKRLFLSSQRVNIFGEFQYSIDNRSVSISKLRFESESGIVEEISGNLRFNEPKVRVNLKFKDWGLTLEQVLTLIDEVPKNMRIKGGNFVLERSLEGTLDKLQSSYRLLLNNLSFDSRTVKIKGLGLLIEFP